MKPNKRMLIVAALALSAATTQAAVIFSDNFEANPVGQNGVPATWTVQNGTVDIVSGGFCLNGSTRCIDLDGSTNNAGELAHSFLAVSGVTYTLSYQLSGNRRAGSETVTVELGGLSQSHTLAALDALQTFTLDFLASATGTEAFKFSNAGGNNVGLILDNVVLANNGNGGTVPEPSTLLLLGAGFAGWGLSRRQRSHPGV